MGACIAWRTAGITERTSSSERIGFRAWGSGFGAGKLTVDSEQHATRSPESTYSQNPKQSETRQRAKSLSRSALHWPYTCLNSVGSAFKDTEKMNREVTVGPPMIGGVFDRIIPGSSWRFESSPLIEGHVVCELKNMLELSDFRICLQLSGSELQGG